jgi:TnpA family transposase
MLKGTNMATIKASHAAFLKRYKNQPESTFYKTIFPSTTAFHIALKKAHSLNYAHMYRIILKLQTELRFLYQLQNTQSKTILYSNCPEN